jgi:hypothetical protein
MYSKCKHCELYMYVDTINFEKPVSLTLQADP